MSDSASKKSEIPLPTLSRSQIENTEKQPTLGDISSIQSDIKGTNSTDQNVGNTQNVAATSVSDVLGDITLLEEAFAEMEVSVADYEQEIPMLRSSIEQPSSISQVEIEAVEACNQSIPVLDQPPTEFIEDPDTSNDSIHIGTNPDADSTTESHSNIPTLENDEKTETSALESKINSVISPPENTDTKPPIQTEATDKAISAPETVEVDIVEQASSLSVTENHTDAITEDPENIDEIATPITTTSEPIAESPNELLELSMAETDKSQTKMPKNDAIQTEMPEENMIETPASELSTQTESGASHFSQASEPVSTSDDDLVAPDATSLEDHIASVTGDAEPNVSNSDIENTEEQISTELAPSIIEDIATPPINSPSDEVNMSIPFELHAQLSKKIDALVLDATLSLTSELQNQLSLQLESLLCGAVEAVLPRLVDQMVNELRAEVKGRVQQQLPIIVNEVLGKTRLS